MIDHPGFRFYHIPKTGGTTIAHFLLAHVPGCKRNPPAHRPPIEVPLERLSFTVVRKPDDWILSFFRDLKQKKFAGGYPENIWAHANFNEFVKAILKSNRTDAWCSHVYSTYLIEPRLIVLPTEKLDSAFPVFCRENAIGIDHEKWSSFGRKNVTGGAKKPAWDEGLRAKWLDVNWWAVEQWEKAMARFE